MESCAHWIRGLPKSDRSGLDAAPASRNTAALANWFRAAHINQVKLAPYGFHCQIGSRYALGSRMYAFSFVSENQENVFKSGGSCALVTYIFAGYSAFMVRRFRSRDGLGYGAKRSIVVVASRGIPMSGIGSFFCSKKNRDLIALWGGGAVIVNRRNKSRKLKAGPLRLRNPDHLRRSALVRLRSMTSTKVAGLYSATLVCFYFAVDRYPSARNIDDSLPPACKRAWLIAWDVPTKVMYVRAPLCARRSPATAAVRVARRQGGNNGLVQRTPQLTYSGANFQDHDTRRSVRYSSLLHYSRAGSS
jgi:hypothetical protein